MGGLGDIIPDEDHGSDTGFRYLYQDLLAVPLCAELAKGHTDLVAIYPEFVEDIAAEHEDFWRFIQVKSHLETAQHWSLTEVIGKVLPSLWRAHVTIGPLAEERGLRYELGAWLSGRLKVEKKRGGRDLIQVLAAHAEAGRLVDQERWIERIRERFDDCSAEDAAALIDELVEELTRVQVDDAEVGGKRKLSQDEGRILAERCWVEDMPPLDGVEAAVKLGLHEQLPHLSLDEFEPVFERVVGRIRRAASAATERSQHARLFAIVTHGNEVREGWRLQAEAKRLTIDVVAPLLESVSVGPVAAGRVSAEVLDQVTIYRGSAAFRLDYPAETAGTIDYYTASFVGRDDEQQRVHDFVADPEPASSYLLIEATGGLGKSALMAELIRTGRTARWPGVKPDIVYMFVSRRGARNTATSFLQALNSQLLGYLGLDDGLPTNLDELRAQLSQLWSAAQRAGARDTPLVLFVDGLDEMAPATTAYPVTIADVLPVPTSPWVRVVLSSRPRPDARESVPPDHPLAQADVVLLHTFDDAGVRRMVETALAEAPVLHPDFDDLDAAALDQLAARTTQITGGEPLMLRFVGEELASGGYGQLDKLEKAPPKDAEAYFRLQFEALDHVADGDTAWDALGVLVVARAAVTPAEIADILGKKRRHVRQAIELIDRFLIGEDRLELMHDRLHELVSDEFSKGELTELSTQLLEWCAGFAELGWPEDTPEYAIDHYGARLEEAGDRDGLLGLVTKEWMLRHFEARHGYGGYVRDVERALDAVATADPPDLGSLARCSLVGSTLRSVAGATPSRAIEVLARLGHMVEAKGQAEFVEDPVRRAETFARLAGAAHSLGDDAAARSLASAAIESIADADLGELGDAYEPLCHVLTALEDRGSLERALELAMEYEGIDSWSQPAMVMAADALAILGEPIDLAPELVDSMLFLELLAYRAAARDDHALLQRIIDVAETAPDDDAIAAALVAASSASRGEDIGDRALEAVDLASGSRSLARVSHILASHGLAEEATLAAERAVVILESDGEERFTASFGADDLVKTLGAQRDIDRLGRMYDYAATVPPLHVDSLYAALAAAFAHADSLDQARACIDLVDSDGSYEAAAWIGVIRATVDAGDLDSADSLAMANHEETRTEGLALVALALAERSVVPSDTAAARALELAYSASAAANSLEKEHYAASALAELAGELATVSTADATRLMERAMVEFGDSSSQTLGTVRPMIAGWVAVGDLEQALTCARQVPGGAHETVGPILRAAHADGNLRLSESLFGEMVQSLDDEQFDSFDGLCNVADAALARGLEIDVAFLVAKASDENRGFRGRPCRDLGRVIRLLVSHGRDDHAQEVRPLLDATTEAVALARGDLVERTVERDERWAEDEDAEVDDLPDIGDVVTLGRAYEALGEQNAAREAARVALELHRRAQAFSFGASDLLWAVQVLLAGGEADLVDEVVSPSAADWWSGGLASSAVAAGDGTRAARWLQQAFTDARPASRPAWFSALNNGAAALLSLGGPETVMAIFEAMEEVDGWMAPRSTP